MLKKKLRVHYLQLRKDTPPQDLLLASLGIANELLKLPIWSFDNYHLFLQIPGKNEIDTSFILSLLHGKDKNIILPKVSSDRSLKHYLLTDSLKLKESAWGIPEPLNGIEVSVDTLDVVFVPLLAFDEKGNRVGYGKGFYDIFLKQCRPEMIKVGLSMFEAVESITDVNNTDVRLDFCVTPNKIYKFSSDL